MTATWGAPTEPPHAPELALDTVAHSPAANGERLFSYLQARGFVQPAGAHYPEVGEVC